MVFIEKLQIMHLISKSALKEFWEKKENRDSQEVLDVWYRKIKQGKWQNIAELKQVFPHADVAGKCIIFNVGGNKYRIVTKIFFREQTVLVRFVLTHKEYDKKPYKNDCN